jgi:hypothetical protein
MKAAAFSITSLFTGWIAETWRRSKQPPTKCNYLPINTMSRPRDWAFMDTVAVPQRSAAVNTTQHAKQTSVRLFSRHRYCRLQLQGARSISPLQFSSMAQGPFRSWRFQTRPDTCGEAVSHCLNPQTEAGLLMYHPLGQGDPTTPPGTG